MMQTVLMYGCLAGAAMLVPLCTVLWLHEKGVFPLREALRRFRSLPPLAQVVVLAFAVNLIVYGSTKAPTNSPPLGLSAQPSVNACGFTDGEVAAGFALARVGTNETWDSSMPEDAAEISVWRCRGASSDWQPMDVPGWPGLVTADGRVLDRANGADVEYRVFPATLGLVPAPFGDSRVWYRQTAVNTLQVTWRNACLNRDTNTPVDVQAEFSDNGNVVYRYDLSRAGADVTNICPGARASGLVGTNLSSAVTSLYWYRIRPEDLASGDRDGDGIPTAVEIRTLGTDPDQWDSDGDGLGDGEEVARSCDPLARDSDGDGLVDGSDPDPRTVTDLTDADGDGIPDAYETHWFGGTGAVDATDVRDATGFMLATKIAAGMNPTNGASSYRTVSADELVSWKLWDAFAAPAGGTNLVYERTVRIDRSNSLQHYFLSSQHGSAGGWWLDGMTLSWEDSRGASGTLTASPVGDSAYLTLSSGQVSWIRFRLVATAGQVRSPRPVYLVAYAPTVGLTGGAEIELGEGLVATVSTEGEDARFGLSVDRSKRPCKAEPYPPERDLSGIAEGLDGRLAFFDEGGTPCLVAAEPGVCELPDFGVKGVANVPLLLGAANRGGTPGRRIVIVLKPSVGWGVHHCYPAGIVWDEEEGYRRESEYPLDTKCLWDGWHRTQTGGVTCDCTPEVGTGFGDCPYVVTDLEVNDSTAKGRITVGGEEVWSGEATHVGETACGQSSWDMETEADACEEDCSEGCPDGDCSRYEGGEAKSLKFRIPTGTPRKGQISGFAYFDTETPIGVTPSVFRFLCRADSLTTVTTNGATRTVVCHDERGRTLTIEPMAGGTRVTVRTTASGALEHTWELVNVNGSPNVVRMRQISRLDNVMSDETYEYAYRTATDDWGWRKTDNITGLREELEKHDALNDDGSYEEIRTRYDADGNWLGCEEHRSEIVGEGESAVLRETYRRLETATNAYVRQASYWTDLENTRRNGRLRLLSGDDCAWGYHDWDAEGRETRRIEQRNGSSVPTDFPAPSAFGTMPTDLSGLTDAFLTVYDYAPLPGDDADTNDMDRVRSEIRYVIANGTATEIGRTWRVYSHEQRGGCAVLREETCRAVRAGASRQDPDNATSSLVTFETRAGTEVPLVLRGEIVERTDEDGLHAVTTVSGDDGRFVLTTRQDRNGVGLPTYTVEERDAMYGKTLRTATCLTSDGSVIEEETNVYDEQNRLRSTTYLDGTSVTNAYSCCRLLWSRDRQGRRVLRSAVTGEDALYWADEDVWLADIQTNGHRVTQHFCDGFGRETNTVVYVGQTQGEATDRTASSGRVLTSATTSYRGEGTDWSVATDARGVIRTSESHASESGEIIYRTTFDGESQEMSETRRLERNGSTLTRQEWDDKWHETVQETAYDANGCRVVTEWSESSDNGLVTNRVTCYDFLGRVTSIWEPNGETVYAYHGSGGRRDTATTSLGAVTQTVYGDFGEEVGTMQDGVTNRSDVVYERDASNDWWKVTRQRTTAPGGREIVRASERVRLTGLGAEAHPPALEGAAGRLVEETASVSADGQTTVRRRWVGAEGAEVEETSDTVAGETTAFRRYGLVLWRETRDGRRSYAYDALGQVVRETWTSADVIRAVTDRSYSAQGDQASVFMYTNATSGTVTSYGYDRFGHQMSVTNWLGEVTTQGYDIRGNLASVDGATYPVRYGYDTSGRRTGLATTRDGTTWDTAAGWTYDPANGRVVRKTFADGSQVGKTYTADGLEARTTRSSGAWREQAYDARRRLVSVTSSDGAQDAAFGYDDFDRQTSVTGGLYGVASALSDGGVATNEQMSVAGEEMTWRRQLDSCGRLAGRGCDGRDWQAVLYAEDGRLMALTTGTAAVSYQYGADGSETGVVVSVAGGITVSRRMDRDPYRGVLREADTFVGEACFRRYLYGHDALNRVRTRSVVKGNGTVVTDYGYDGRGQMTQEAGTADGTTRAWSAAYDAIGNFTSVSRDGTTTAFAADAANRYDGYSYDADGNLLALDGLSLAYDSAGRLTGVSTGGVIVASYAYDPFGRRIRKVTPEATHLYFYDGWLLVEERIVRADETTETVEYFWGKDISGTLDGAGGVGGLVYVKRGGSVCVPVYDGNGNVTAYLDGLTGAAVAEYDYDGFGNTVSFTGTQADAFAFRYSTKYADAETGLLYYGYRYYAPTLGRWLTHDPLEEEGGLNLYCFCGNNPINMVDDLGMRGMIEALSESLCERAYVFGMDHLNTAEERRAWNIYTKHLFVGGRDVLLPEETVLSIAGALPKVIDYMDGIKALCRKGVSFKVKAVKDGNAPSPWVRAIGEVSVAIEAECKNGCLSYSYEINDPYDFDIKGVPGCTCRSAKNESITIAVRMTEVCLLCDWRTFNHRGKYVNR